MSRPNRRPKETRTSRREILDPRGGTSCSLSLLCKRPGTTNSADRAHSPRRRRLRGPVTLGLVTCVPATARLSLAGTTWPQPSQRRKPLLERAFGLLYRNPKPLPPRPQAHQTRRGGLGRRQPREHCKRAGFREGPHNGRTPKAEHERSPESLQGPCSPLSFTLTLNIIVSCEPAWRAQGHGYPRAVTWTARDPEDSRTLGPARR